MLNCSGISGPDTQYDSFLWASYAFLKQQPWFMSIVSEDTIRHCLINNTHPHWEKRGWSIDDTPNHYLFTCIIKSHICELQINCLFHVLLFFVCIFVMFSPAIPAWFTSISLQPKASCLQYRVSASSKGLCLNYRLLLNRQTPCFNYRLPT